MGASARSRQTLLAALIRDRALRQRTAHRAVLAEGEDPIVFAPFIIVSPAASLNWNYLEISNILPQTSENPYRAERFDV